MTPEHEPQIDLQAEARRRERHQSLAIGAMALPNLFLRSFMTLAFLYGALGLVLIALVQFGYLPNAAVAAIIGCVIVGLQYVLGPWIMDLSLRWLYAMSWVQPSELPAHLREFVQKVCDQERMKFPSFGIIHDGAPQAFTYGHHPGNARVVISQGIIDLLTPEELEAVVAHELGHARNWDMALMTLAYMVPFLLYYLYDISLRFRGDKDKDYGLAIAVGAYILYLISEYLVLWFSRTREYYADRFSGEATGNPNALSIALVKIAYGLASRGGQSAGEGASEDEKKEAAKRARRSEAFGALNIFDHRGAVNMVMSSATATPDRTRPELGQIQGAMQWDLWNPWATYYELNSTHPLTAKRMLALSDQAVVMQQEPAVVFDRAKPESYWGTFLIDVAVLWAPTIAFVGGLAMFAYRTFLAQQPAAHSAVWIGIGVMLAGLFSLIRLRFSYRSDLFENLTVAGLLQRVKVSAVRPVPVQLRGQIIGKGVPGLVWSEDFVIRDQTGLIFLDYRQPLRIWEWLFGLFRAGQYQGKEVRITGWYRRAPVPYIEIKHLEVLDGSLPNRRTYTYYVQYLVAGVLLVAGTAATLMLALG
jgi:Zn-dependent protease with chaperone function